jgi:hypothetical protein
MTRKTRRSRSTKDQSFGAGIVEEGAERYIWIYPEGQQLILAIPGLRGLRFSIEEARTVADMLTQAADEMTTNHPNPRESDGSHGSTKEHPAKS